MRLDKFLKNSRLVKRRELANARCDAGQILINNKVAKPSAEVSIGDVIELRFGTTPQRVTILKIPMQALGNHTDTLVYLQYHDTEPTNK
jgi:ribosomal 50S subunit-recycling heat shock protein